jgi:phosphatidylinositol alpha-1,6-mannosyltransferase
MDLKLKNSKQLLIVTSEFPPQPGGIGNHAFNLASQLRLNGYDVTVIADERSTDGEEEKLFDSSLPFRVFRIKRYRLNLWTYLMRILVYKRISNKFSTIIASGKFALWLVGLDFFLSKDKKVAVIHGSEVNLQGAYKHLTNRSLQNFGAVVAVSKFTKSLVASLNLKNIYVIPNGLVIDEFDIIINKQKLKGFPKLITVGAISQRKGQHNVIGKLPELIKIYPKIHYHLVGILSEKEKLLKFANNLNVTNYITFHGIVSRKKLISLLYESDIFVMLSEETIKGDVEGFGISLLEANYMSLPTIGSKNCGIEDAINNYKSGILIDYKDTEAFRIALEEILHNKDEYIKNAKLWAIEHSWETIIKKYMKLL